MNPIGRRDRGVADATRVADAMAKGASAPARFAAGLGAMIAVQQEILPHCDQPGHPGESETLCALVRLSIRQLEAARQSVIELDAKIEKYTGAIYGPSGERIEPTPVTYVDLGPSRSTAAVSPTERLAALRRQLEAMKHFYPVLGLRRDADSGSLGHATAELFGITTAIVDWLGSAQILLFEGEKP